MLSGGFANDGGELAIENLIVRNDANFAGALISLNGGTLQLQDVTVSGSEINVSPCEDEAGKPARNTRNLITSYELQEVISVEGGAAANINGLAVSQVRPISRVVVVEGAGSTADIAASSVENVRTPNDAGEGDAWIAYEATNGATLAVSDTSLVSNRGAASLFKATGDGSTVNIRGVTTQNNEGAQVLVSDFSRVLYDKVLFCLFY